MEQKKDKSGLIFSAILIIAFVICTYFFIGIINGTTDMADNVKLLFKALVFVLFGLILFYATRVGDGKQVKRFSPATLIILDLPALYIVLSAAAPGLPFPFDLTQASEIVWLAAAALGYGVPYTFLSGYEQDVSVVSSEKEPEKEYPKDELDADEADVPEEETDNAEKENE